MKPLPWLVSFIFLFSACTNPVPYNVKGAATAPPTITEQPTAPPLITLLPHPDGLGWTVYPQQPVTQHIQETQAEVWQAYTLTHHSFNPLLASLGVYTCTFSMFQGLLSTLMQPEKPFFPYPLKGCPAMAGYRWSHLDHVEPRPTPHLYTNDVIHPLTTGTLTETWLSSSSPHQQFIHTLNSQTAIQGIPVRLQSLPPNPSSSPPTLLLSLHFSETSQTSVTIPIPPAQWALAQNFSITSPPPSAWPTPLHIRLDTTHPILHDPILQTIYQTLTQANVSVVTRQYYGPPLEDALVDAHQGLYHDSHSLKPGTWTPATLHIFIDHFTPSPHTTQGLVTITDLTTGLILTTFSTPPVPTIRELADPISGNLLHLLAAHDT